DYAQPYFPAFMGLDVAGFWRQMDTCFAALVQGSAGAVRVELDDPLMPSITLDPEPMAWPGPEDFLPDEEEWRMSEGGPLDDFTGVARLFPLPNFVLMPHVVKPLHVFEPRYRQLVSDALAGDQLIALVLLKPDWEGDYEGQPAIHDVACLARILN